MYIAMLLLFVKSVTQQCTALEFRGTSADTRYRICGDVRRVDGRTLFLLLA
jgi:hypothetical protein